MVNVTCVYMCVCVTFSLTISPIISCTQSFFRNKEVLRIVKFGIWTTFNTINHLKITGRLLEVQDLEVESEEYNAHHPLGRRIHLQLNTDSPFLSPPWVTYSSRKPSLLMPCSAQSCLQNSVPTALLAFQLPWFPHCPTCKVMISRGIVFEQLSRLWRSSRYLLNSILLLASFTTLICILNGRRIDISYHWKCRT